VFTNLLRCVRLIWGFKEIGHEAVGWNCLAQNTDQLGALVHMVMKLVVS
jgi:hypothetical protein